ncbi:hypothetical protein [Nonlabens xiamenensis]|uniref:hypothetical protein n=1 Tax=Nonlabens xiamenensis TaxID=2341043 RepID=UPI000F60BEF0|nr:hypothetical protein [Nonlabens xiamenensis]
MSKEEYKCRCCGLKYTEPTWYDKNDASFDICICCGVEFGVQDTHIKSVREYRLDWLQSGAEWFVRESMPKEWEVFDQLKNIESKWF